MAVDLSQAGVNRDFKQRLRPDRIAGLVATLAALDTSVDAAVDAIADKADAVHTHGAADIDSGTIATARLGSGSATSSTFLRGDQTWATPATVGASGSVEFLNTDLATVTLTIVNGLITDIDVVGP